MRSETLEPCTRHGIRCGVAILLGGLAMPAFAQEQAEQQTVVVTGSRIRTDPLNQPAPLTTVTDADIARSGTTSVGDVLQRMTSSGGGLNTRFNTSGRATFRRQPRIRRARTTSTTSPSTTGSTSSRTTSS